MRAAAALAALSLLLGACASPQQLRPFTTDRCSLFPEGTGADPQRWCECCVTHDKAYWRGGSADERKQADRAFRDCVQAKSGSEALGSTMYRGVRLGGPPWWPTPFRWAYGWGYGRGYTPLSEAERARADALLGEAAPAACTAGPRQQP